MLGEERYGFLTTDDDRESYFHKNSVLNRAFLRLKVGTMVSFAEESGEKDHRPAWDRVIEQGESNHLRIWPYPQRATPDRSPDRI